MFRGHARTVAAALGPYAGAGDIVLVSQTDSSEWEIESDVVQHT